MLSSYGNVNGERTYYNLVNLAGVLDIGCKIFKGADNALNNKPAVFTDYHGKNGLCGLELPGGRYPPPQFQSVNMSMAANLEGVYELAKEFGDIKYIAVGPLTNLAALFEAFPDCADYVSELIIMGGGFKVSNVANGAEYNFSMDADAVKKVLSTPVKKIIAPLDMTHKLAFSLEEIEDIVGMSRETSKKSACVEAFEIFAELFYLNYETAVKHYEAGAIIHDAATLAYLLDPGKCELREYKISSDEYGAIQKAEKAEKDEAGCWAWIIENIDRAFVKNMLKETFGRLKV